MVYIAPYPIVIQNSVWRCLSWCTAYKLFDAPFKYANIRQQKRKCSQEK